MGEADVQQALERLARLLDEKGIPYALIGAMGEGLQRFKAAAVGHGYVEKFPGSRGLRDATTGVNIELKLASGLSAPHRLKDLADVLELIRHLSLPRDLAGSLDASVRPKFEELWQAAQTADRE